MRLSSELLLVLLLFVLTRRQFLPSVHNINITHFRKLHENYVFLRKIFLRMFWWRMPPVKRRHFYYHKTICSVPPVIGSLRLPIMGPQLVCSAAKKSLRLNSEGRPNIVATPLAEVVHVTGVRAATPSASRTVLGRCPVVRTVIQHQLFHQHLRAVALTTNGLTIDCVVPY